MKPIVVTANVTTVRHYDVGKTTIVLAADGCVGHDLPQRDCKVTFEPILTPEELKRESRKAILIASGYSSAVADRIISLVETADHRCTT